MLYRVCHYMILGTGTRQREGDRAKSEPRAKSVQRLSGGKVTLEAGKGLSTGDSIEECIGRLIDLSRRQEKIGVDTSVHEAANVLRGDISCTPTGVVHEIRIMRQRGAKDQAEVVFLEVTTDQIT
jgi:hypothetical protein